MWIQKEIRLAPRARGFHLVSREIFDQLPELAQIETGLLQLFLQHTSASLSINENADPAVLRDLERHLEVLVPEGAAHFEHTAEGPDDMPAHVKSALLGCSLTLPLEQGSLRLGTWQGLYLGEHRDEAAGRRIIATLCGEEKFR